MASKYLDEFLAKASPETKAVLEQSRQKLKEHGLREGYEAQIEKKVVTEREDVKQIGQRINRNALSTMEHVADRSETPARIGASRPYADAPNINDKSNEQIPSPAVEKTRHRLQRNGQQNVTQKRENAFDRAMTSPTTEKIPAVEKAKEMDQER